MILIGQFDSSFVRRVGIALKLYGLSFEHRPWSVFSDKEKIRPLNPLMRVPVLVLDDEDVLVDSHLILAHLESLAPAGRSLYPASEPDRHRAFKVAGLATGIADKGVSLFYEQVLHEEVSPLWVERCRAQIAGALSMLEEDRAERQTTYWFGEGIGHADIAVACAIRHTTEALPDVLTMQDYPALRAHCERLEALAVFKEISQPFIPPA
ncbi:glutathione S-transferase family protein [Mesorhizobium sp. KR9-304]|uniref:glutathione S-transferase family protein n=1 Tax=Mesorhizobium sp. KR9-304 TaxID=3156614 RepID=UPI0032B52322